MLRQPVVEGGHQRARPCAASLVICCLVCPLVPSRRCRRPTVPAAIPTGGTAPDCTVVTILWTKNYSGGVQTKRPDGPKMSDMASCGRPRPSGGHPRVQREPTLRTSRERLGELPGRAALPAAPTRTICRVYDVARVIDDLGDQAPGDRTALLRDFRADLDTIWAGGHAVGRPSCGGSRRLCAPDGLSRRAVRRPDRGEPAWTRRCRATRPTRTCCRYCELSAEPGRPDRAGVFGAARRRRIALSDRICTALQIIEHCQDVGEDQRAGRVYLPRRTCDRFGVRRRPRRASAGPDCDAVAFEAERAAGLLAEGDARSCAQLQRLGPLWPWPATSPAAGRGAGAASGRAGDVLARSARPSRRTTAIARRRRCWRRRRAAR